MSIETNKAIVRRYIEQVHNQHRSDLAEEFLAEDVVLHYTGLEPGLKAVQQWLTLFAEAFPDRHLTIEDVVAEGDRVVVRTSFKGTHQGEMQGIPATGKTIRLPSVTIFRLENGKIAEGWVVNDNLGMMQQLGVIPQGAA
jgi:steroid delta-isomerase-like uncharacterized protein